MIHIEHLAIWTADLERLRAFYETYFHAQAGPKYTNPARQFESYFLTFAGGARLELMQVPNLAHLPAGDLQPVCGYAQLSANNPQPFCGYAHLAIALGSPDAVIALTQRLQANGFVVLSGPRTTGDGYFESLVLDPDGNHLELTV